MFPPYQSPQSHRSETKVSRIARYKQEQRACLEKSPEKLGRRPAGLSISTQRGEGVGGFDGGIRRCLPPPLRRSVYSRVPARGARRAPLRSTPNSWSRAVGRGARAAGGRSRV